MFAKERSKQQGYEIEKMKVPSQVGALKESKLVIQQTEEGDFGTYQVDSIAVSLFTNIETAKQSHIRYSC